MLKKMAEVRQTLKLSPRTSAPALPDLVAKANLSPNLTVAYQRPSRAHSADSTSRVGNTAPALKAQRPPRDFRAAIKDVDYRPINPGLLKVPPFFLKAIKDAETVLIVSHVNTDHDALAAAKTLERLLLFLGKTVDVCIDDDLSASQRRFDPERSVKRARQLKGGDWDLAVVVDVAGKNRIGDAAALLDGADEVIVGDHHRPPKQAHLDLVQQYNCEGTSWRDPGIDAAAIQMCAVAEQLLVGVDITREQAAHIFAPALAGIVTDTGWGTHDNLSPYTPAIFKHVYGRARVPLDALQKNLEIQPPRELTEALTKMNGLVSRDSRNGLFILQVSRASMQQLVKLGASHDPPLNERDVVSLLKQMASAQVGRGTDCTALMLETEKGAWSLSFRSHGQNAIKLANAFGSGGHDDAAAATTYGCDGVEAKRRLIEKATSLAIIR